MANITAIKLPNNTTYQLKDEVSGYTTNEGTVTSVAVSGSTGISVSGSPITAAGTIIITNTGVTSFNGSTGAITLGNATTTTAGLMSATDKTTLDNLASASVSGTQVQIVRW